MRRAVICSHAALCGGAQLTLRAASKDWLVEFYEAGGLTALVMNLSDVEVIEEKTDKDVQVVYSVVGYVESYIVGRNRSCRCRDILSPEYIYR